MSLDLSPYLEFGLSETRSLIYRGAAPWMALYVIRIILKSILCFMFNQESLVNKEVLWQNLGIICIITRDLYQTCFSNTGFKERYGHLDQLLGKLTLNKLNLSFQCGRSFEPRFLFAWPTAQVAMDTAENMVDICVAEVMYSCSTEGGRRKKVWLNTFICA